MKVVFYIIAASLFIGCAEGGDGATGAGGLPDGSTVTCGDFTVDLSQTNMEEEEPSDENNNFDPDSQPNPGIGNPAVSRAVSQKIEEVEALGLEVVDIKYLKESVVVVGCGGTVITNTTTVTNDVSGSGSEN